MLAAIIKVHGIRRCQARIRGNVGGLLVRNKRRETWRKAPSLMLEWDVCAFRRMRYFVYNRLLEYKRKLWKEDGWCSVGIFLHFTCETFGVAEQDASPEGRLARGGERGVSSPLSNTSTVVFPKPMGFFPSDVVQHSFNPSRTLAPTTSHWDKSIKWYCVARRKKRHGNSIHRQAEHWGR